MGHCSMSILLLAVHYSVYITSIVFSYIAKRSAGFLTCWLLSCHKSPHLCKITMVEVHLFWLRENNKQGNNNCIMQHEYFIILDKIYQEKPSREASPASCFSWWHLLIYFLSHHSWWINTTKAETHIVRQYSLAIVSLMAWNLQSRYHTR